MADSSIFAGERDGPRVFRVGRIGYDSGNLDPSSTPYTALLRSERIAPGGPGSLINFRRVALHLLVSGSYTFTVRVWVDNGRTVLGDATVQTIVVDSSGAGLREVTEEIAIEAEGSHIQVELEVDSNDTTGLFLVESIVARGRAIRASATRSAEVT